MLTVKDKEPHAALTTSKPVFRGSGRLHMQPYLIGRSIIGEGERGGKEETLVALRTPLGEEKALVRARNDKEEEVKL